MSRELTTEVWIPRPRQEVFEFFANAGNLETLTPPWLNFRILTPTPIAMRPGALIDYKLRVHGVPLNWRTEISVWEPPFRFEDRQLKGPYRRWEHEHTFVEKDGGTLVRDRVIYQPPGWILEPLIHRWFVGPDLKRIFDFRLSAMRKYFGA